MILPVQGATTATVTLLSCGVYSILGLRLNEKDCPDSTRQANSLSQSLPKLDETYDLR